MALKGGVCSTYRTLAVDKNNPLFATSQVCHLFTASTWSIRCSILLNQCHFNGHSAGKPGFASSNSVFILYLAQWCNGKAFGLAISRSQVQILL